MLVKVPPGTPAGTVLNVELPDVPGVFVSAPVPPNVSEFHVSYTETPEVWELQKKTKKGDVKGRNNNEVEENRRNRRMEYAKVAVQVGGVFVQLAGVVVQIAIIGVMN
jgi:hypothetical protein